MIDSFRGEYRWLSNFHEHPIHHLGLVFPTTEAAYQATKRLDDWDFIREVASQRSPGKAMRLGRSLPITTPNWHKSVKFSVMRELNTQKFLDDDLGRKLLATGDEELVERNDWGDRVWGVCEGTGANHLGRILMEIRRNLRLGL